MKGLEAVGRATRFISSQRALHQLAILAVAAVIVGCSGDDSSEQPANNTSSNNASVDSGGGEDTGEGTDDAGANNSNNGETDAGTAPLGDPTMIVPSELATTDELATNQACSDCHAGDGISNAMLDSAGRNVAPVDLWSSTMKANSARDPFFLAVLSVDKKLHPELADTIEETCLSCHAPLATADARWNDEQVALSDLTEGGTRGVLGADGVSCVACHAMTDEGFGTMESFSGGFVLNAENEIYGPHADPFARPMEMQSGFTPVASNHVMESEQCATCHTLFTPTIGDDGTIIEGSAFPEQTPYLEWKNSTFSSGENAQSCQDCHAPTTDVDGAPIVTELAHRPDGGLFPPTTARSPYGRHLFVGGNTLFPRIFKQYREELGVTASDAAFDATIAATRRQLQTKTAELAIANAGAANGTVSFDVSVTNLTGHKFPTAYPSRRAWLRVRVLDGSGNVLLESGGVNDAGQILGADGQPIAAETPGTPLEPHYATVTEPNAVQIFQSVLSDGEAPTVHLLSAAEYAKDNRILPSGWSSEHPDAGPALPVGTDDDADFVAGGDTVRYELPVSGEPASVEVELLYQPLGARWATDLFRTRTADNVRLEQMIEGVGGLGFELVAGASADL